MNFIYKIPGYILLLFGAFCLSWGGFIVRSFEEANVWQILLIRSVFFGKFEYPKLSPSPPHGWAKYIFLIPTIKY